MSGARALLLPASDPDILSLPQAPNIAPGRHCTKPVTCEFYDRCNSPRPDNHIGYLPLIHASAVEELPSER